MNPVVGTARLSYVHNAAIAEQLAGIGGEAGHDLYGLASAAKLIEWDRSVLAAAGRVLDTDWLLVDVDGCRHLHLNDRPDDEPEFHVDDYCGEPWPDDRRFVIVCYFPLGATIDDGPTEARSDGDRRWPAIGPAGTFLAMRHDTEHRALGNRNRSFRPMVKLLFSVEA